MRAWRTGDCRRWDSSLCRPPSRPSPRSSGRFKSKAKPAGPKANMRVFTFSITARSQGRSTCPSASGCCRSTRSGHKVWPKSAGRPDICPKSWAGHHHFACAHSRISVHLALPRVRRIPREREREPPGGHAARRKEHRRITGGPQPDIPSLAPEWHRRGTVRRRLWLRSAERRGAIMRIDLAASHISSRPKGRR